MIFEHNQEPEFMMSEDQAIEQLENAISKMLEDIKSNDPGAEGWAVLAFKVARHLEWVQNCCPLLQGDGSALIQAVKAWKERTGTNATS
jgi:hypothetical protein